jgi:hypothetical protein
MRKINTSGLGSVEDVDIMCCVIAAVRRVAVQMALRVIVRRNVDVSI